MSNEENNFEKVVLDNQNYMANNISDVKECVDEIKKDSSSSHYWAALVAMVIMSGLVAWFVMHGMTNDQGDIVEIIEDAPYSIRQAVETAIGEETISTTISNTVNHRIDKKLSELNAAIKNYEMKLEEVSKDEGSLTKFCPGFNRSGNRETFKLAQMLAFDKSDTDLSFNNAKQICTLDKKGCMVCRVLGRTKPCDYSANGGCSEVATQVDKDTYQETKEEICSSFTTDSKGWDKSGCGKD